MVAVGLSVVPEDRSCRSRKIDFRHRLLRNRVEAYVELFGARGDVKNRLKVSGNRNVDPVLGNNCRCREHRTAGCKWKPKALRSARCAVQSFADRLIHASDRSAA